MQTEETTPTAVTQSPATEVVATPTGQPTAEGPTPPPPTDSPKRRQPRTHGNLSGQAQWPLPVSSTPCDDGAACAATFVIGDVLYALSGARVRRSVISDTIVARGSVSTEPVAVAIRVINGVRPEVMVAWRSKERGAKGARTWGAWRMAFPSAVRQKDPPAKLHTMPSNMPNASLRSMRAAPVGAADSHSANMTGRPSDVTTDA